MLYRLPIKTSGPPGILYIALNGETVARELERRMGDFRVTYDAIVSDTPDLHRQVADALRLCAARRHSPPIVQTSMALCAMILLLLRGDIVRARESVLYIYIRGA